MTYDDWKLESPEDEDERLNGPMRRKQARLEYLADQRDEFLEAEQMRRTMTTTCDYHNHSSIYPMLLWARILRVLLESMPQVFRIRPQNRVEGLTKLVKGKFTKGPYNIVWGNPVEIYDGDQLLAAIPHHPRGEHTPNACLFNEAPHVFADLDIFCKILDEFYPENIYAGENFDESWPSMQH